MKKVLLILITSFICIPQVLAAGCSYQEQADYNKIAAKVLPQYEIVTETIDPSLLLDPGIVTDDILYLTVYNISPEIYLVINNDRFGDNGALKDWRINYSDTEDGVYKMRWGYKDMITKFTIDIYSSEQTNCPNEKLTVKTFIMPKENEYYHYSMCEGIKHKYCQQFIDFEEPGESTILKAIESERNNKNNTTDQTDTNETPSSINWIPIAVCSGAGIILLTTLIVIFIKKKNAKNRRVKNEKF